MRRPRLLKSTMLDKACSGNIALRIYSLLGSWDLRNTVQETLLGNLRGRGNLVRNWCLYIWLGTRGPLFNILFNILYKALALLPPGLGTRRRWFTLYLGSLGSVISLALLIYCYRDASSWKSLFIQIVV
jgi:hypothetical protein